MPQMTVIILATLLTLAPIDAAEPPNLPTPTGLYVVEPSTPAAMDRPQTAENCQARLRATLLEVLADAVAHGGRLSVTSEQCDPTCQGLVESIDAVLRECP